MRYRDFTRLALLLLAALAAPAVGLGQVVDGVAVDAEGVLRTKMVTDASGRLNKERIAAARVSLNPKLATYSKMRFVSLKHLEQAILDHGAAATAEMRNLAGLLRVRYVFFYPDSKDIVLAGPAEGWGADSMGRSVGLTSGRPVLQLQDLAVALRAFPPQGAPTKFIGCSIDPTKEGLAAMQRFLQSIGSNATPNDTQFIVNGLQTSLGLQTISVNGISPKTHFALVMVEADYRMKLIGIGLETPPVKMVSYVQRANPSMVSRNGMVRWFFTPDYECVRTTEDGTAMELVGDGVKLVGEDELVTAEGRRQGVSRSNKASQAFVTSFTQKYSELADRSPVYAELRNMIDLSVAAAYIQNADLYTKAEWKMPCLGDETAFAVETYNVPKQVATAVNAIWRGHSLMTPVGGGVAIEPTRALNARLADTTGKLGKVRQQVTIKLAKGQWWWD